MSICGASPRPDAHAAATSGVWVTWRPSVPYSVIVKQKAILVHWPPTDLAAQTIQLGASLLTSKTTSLESHTSTRSERIPFVEALGSAPTTHHGRILSPSVRLASEPLLVCHRAVISYVFHCTSRPGRMWPFAQAASPYPPLPRLTMSLHHVGLQKWM